MTYPLKFRRHILAIRNREGLTIKELSVRFGVGLASIVRWIKRIEPKTNYNRPAIRIDMNNLARDIELYPDAYLDERAMRLGVSRNCVFEAQRRLGVTYKKSPPTSKGRRRKTASLPNEDQSL